MLPILCCHIYTAFTKLFQHSSKPPSSGKPSSRRRGGGGRRATSFDFHDAAEGKDEERGEREREGTNAPECKIA